MGEMVKLFLLTIFIVFLVSFLIPLTNFLPEEYREVGTGVVVGIALLILAVKSLSIALGQGRYG